MLDLHSNYPVLSRQHVALRSMLQEATDLVGIGKPLRDFLGAQRHRAAASRWLSPDADLDEDCVAVCAGGNHACLVVLWALGLAGRAVAVDPLTYSGFIAQAAMLGVALVEVRADAHGMLPDALAEVATRVGAVYLIPTVHNPLGYVMPLERRLALIDVARSAEIPIVQDDAYHFLEPEPPAHFCRLAPDRSFTIMSFSKPVSPDVKIAFLTFPAQYRDRISTAIRLTSSGTSEALAEFAVRCVTSSLFDELVAAKRAVAAQRQAIVRDGLAGTGFVAHPTSFHAWVQLDSRYDARDVANRLKIGGILTTPGNEFSPSQNATGFLRIALSNAENPEALAQALQAVREYARAC